MRYGELIIGTARPPFDRFEDLSAAKQVVEAALEAGVVRFDTAPGYRDSESVLGEALKEVRPSGCRLQVSTKFHNGRDPILGDFAEHLKRSVDSSLRRLRIDRIDCLYLHSTLGVPDLEAAFFALDEQVARGTARSWGLSAISQPQLALVASMRAEGRLLHGPRDRQVELNIAIDSTRCHRLEAGTHTPGRLFPLVAYSTLAYGLLTGKYVADRAGDGLLARRDYASLAARAEALYGSGDAVLWELAQIAESLDCSMASAAVAWSLSRPSVVAAIVGCSKEEHVSEALVGLRESARLKAQMQDSENA